MIDVRIQSARFEPGQQLARLSELGSVAVASVMIACPSDEEIAESFIDHYPPLAKSELGRIAQEVAARWSLTGIILLHRYGTVQPGESIALVAAGAPNAAAAIEACAEADRQIRIFAPFWRKDRLASGQERWLTDEPDPDPGSDAEAGSQ